MLNTLWFILIAVLFIGFLFLEGFDYGVGMLLRILTREDHERRAIINTIGPVWDANEVWMITAGGAMFAAFPHVYATLFSGFYLALVLLLGALIVRGLGFEFRSKEENPRWRNAWDWAIFVGSLVPALLWGVALSNLIRGVPVDRDMHYVGTLFDLLNPYALLGGINMVVAFLLHGALFLGMKLEGSLRERACRFAERLWPWTTGLFFLFIVYSYFETDFVQHVGVNPGVIPVLGVLSLLSSGYFIRRRDHGKGFVLVALSVVFITATLFVALYPRLIVSSLNPDWSLTIYNAASSPYTLRVMLIITLILLPIVLLYQGWTYYTFRHRIRADRPEEMVY